MSALRAGARVALAATLLYLPLIRRWQLRWGASDAEVTGPLPGDDQVPHPSWEATRCVEVEAPADEVWPWLVQLGYGRGGFYSYDRLDNAGRPSAREIRPELQELAVGDVIQLDANTGATVVELKPGSALVICARDLSVAGALGTFTQAFVLEEGPGGTTRLISRIRLDGGRGVAPTAYIRLVFEPVDFLMNRRQLLGIKERAESLAGTAPARRTEDART